MIRSLLFSSVLLVTLCACDSGVLVSEKWKMEDHQWITGDVKSFAMEAIDTTTVYEMAIELNHEATYGFQNFYIRTLTTFPSGKEVTSVTSIELIKPDGDWVGDCSGSSCTIDMPLQSRFTFPEVGSYTWAVEPYMRMDTVMGINSLKVTCRKVKE